MPNFYLGCDVSKGYADFIVLDSGKKIIEPVFQLDDTFEGHNRLYNFLQNLFNRYPDTTLFCAVESTGGLENNWLALFKRLADIMTVKSARSQVTSFLYWYWCLFCYRSGPQYRLCRSFSFSQAPLILFWCTSRL